MRSGSNFFGSKFLKGETPVGGCKWNAFSHHPALVPGRGQELSLAGTVTVGWTSGVLPTLHILPALVFSCPAVYWDNNLLSCLGPWPRSGSVAGCWHGHPTLPRGLHSACSGPGWGAQAWRRPDTSVHGSGRVPTLSSHCSCSARGQ